MADNVLPVNTDGWLQAQLDKVDGTPLLRAEVSTLTLTLKVRRAAFDNVTTPRAIPTTDLHATSGALLTPLLKAEQAILVSGKKEETHRAIVRGVLADGKEFEFSQDYQITNEAS